MGIARDFARDAGVDLDQSAAEMARLNRMSGTQGTPLSSSQIDSKAALADLAARGAYLQYGDALIRKWAQDRLTPGGDSSLINPPDQLALRQVIWGDPMARRITGFTQ